MIGNLIIGLSFFTAILGMVRYKKLTMPFKLVSIYLLYSFLLDILNIYVNARFKHNMALVHIETITNYIFYLLIYFFLFKNRLIKNGLIASIFPMAVFAIVSGLYIQPFNAQFPVLVSQVSEVIYLLIALLMFKQMLNYPLQINIMKQSVFWYNTGILLYSATMFLNLGLMNYYSKHGASYLIVYYWYSIDIIFNVMLGIAILVDRKELAKQYVQ